MIVKMKKIHMIVQKKDMVSALESLRELGSVHVEHQELLTGSLLEDRREEVGNLENIIGILKAAVGTGKVEQREASNWSGVVNEILALSVDAERCRESIARRAVRIRRWELWGDFDPKEIEEIADSEIRSAWQPYADKVSKAKEKYVNRVMFSGKCSNFPKIPSRRF